jgi:hypothetical protein
VSSLSDGLRVRMNSIEHVARTTYSNSDLEPQLVELLVYLRENAVSQAELEPVLIEGLDTVQESIIQTIGFTMHELRWNGVREHLLQERRSTTKFGPGRSIDRMLEAYDDDWEEAYSYDYYRTGLPED